VKLVKERSLVGYLPAWFHLRRRHPACSIAAASSVEATSAPLPDEPNVSAEIQNKTLKPANPRKQDSAGFRRRAGFSVRGDVPKHSFS
jgi:hypothetical protein